MPDKIFKTTCPSLYSLIVHILHWNTNLCFRDTSGVFLWLRKPMAHGPYSYVTLALNIEIFYGSSTT